MREGVEVAEPTRSHGRGALALALLFIGIVALGVAWIGDPRAASFSDAGGRLATVKTMAENHTWTPDLGYWASGVDPSGLHHPILFAYPAWRQLGGGERSPTRGRRPSSLAARRCAPPSCSQCSASCSRPTPRAACRGGRRGAMDGSRCGSWGCSPRSSSTALTSGSTRPRSRWACSRSPWSSKAADVACCSAA